MKTFNVRVGQGVDVHAFCNDRPLLLGGVRIPYDRGLSGHSDADVVTHAIMDALLGAAGLGDIGKHFPDTDQQYRNISSLILLKQVVQMLQDKHFQIGNIDVTVVAQEPQVNPYIKKMQQVLAPILDIPIDAISIKATTSEHLGFTGRQEGIAAVANALIGY
jgi:2-C-methyl-D-erythritol 2,4-cyclodiphosphate synthase